MSSTESQEKSHHARWPSVPAAFRDEATCEPITAAKRCVATKIGDVTAAYEPAMHKRLLKYATGRCNWLDHRGDRGARGEAEELVQAAIVDTWMGVVTWDPSVDLTKHLMDVIQSRTAWRLERSNSRRHLSLQSHLDSDTESESEDDPDVTSLVDACHEVPSSDLDLARRQVAAQVLAWLKQSSDDLAVVGLLGHYRDGLVRRHEVIEAGMSVEGYDNARRKLDRLLENAPATLRDSATACWRDA